MSARHERRRRLLTEEALDAAEAGDVGVRLSGAADEPQAAYASGAKRECQRPLVDLLPHRRATITLIVGGLLLAIGLLTALDAWSSRLGEFAGGVELPALRIDRPESCARWLATTLLFGSVPLAWLVYALRRHRVDDYSGRYRVWLSVGLACLLGSLLEGSELGQALHAVLLKVCQPSGLDAAIVGPALVALLLAAGGLRLLIEIRQCSIAVALWTSGATAMLVSVALGAEWIPTAISTPAALARAAWLVAYVFLVGLMLVYSRFVRLQISGGAALPKPKRKVRVKASSNDKPSDEPIEKPRPALQLRTDLDPVQPAASRSSDTIKVNDHARSGLSRAERRKMRRERMAG